MYRFQNFGLCFLGRELTLTDSLVGLITFLETLTGGFLGFADFGNTAPGVVVAVVVRGATPDTSGVIVLVLGRKRIMVNNKRKTII